MITICAFVAHKGFAGSGQTTSQMLIGFVNRHLSQLAANRLQTFSSTNEFNDIKYVTDSSIVMKHPSLNQSSKSNWKCL